MQRFSPFLIGFLILWSPSFFLAPAFLKTSDPIQQPQITSKISGVTNNGNFVSENKAEVGTFGSTNFCLTINMTGNLANFGIDFIYQLKSRQSSKSLSAPKEFIEVFFANTHLKIFDYNKKGTDVKNEITKKLKAKAPGFGKQLVRKLNNYLQSKKGGDNGCAVFLGQKTDNNIGPQGRKVDERIKVYRVHGETIQIAGYQCSEDSDGAGRKFEDDRSYFIPDCGIRVFPNTELVHTSGIGKYLPNLRKTKGESGETDGEATPATVVLHNNTAHHTPPYPVKNYVKGEGGILSEYSAQYSLTVEEGQCNEGDEKGDASNSPNLYLNEGEAEDPFRRPPKPNFRFGIKSPQSGRFIVLLPLVVLIDFHDYLLLE